MIRHADDKGSPSPGPHASPWLSVNQIRLRQRMRRERVIAAMDNGQLPYEQRGRCRYAHIDDIIRWEKSRTQASQHTQQIKIREDLVDLV